jgi:acetyl esterase/lipase
MCNQREFEMSSKLECDPRIDPRIKASLAGFELAAGPNVSSREELLAQEYSKEALAGLARVTEFFDSMDSEEVAPSKGLAVRTEIFTSSPDGNRIKIQYIRADTDKILPCVTYIHGGGMATSSCYQGNFKAWGRMIAAHGVAVAMVDFRNAVHSSSTPDTAPFPAGLNDCISGVKWVYAKAASLGIDPRRIIVAGKAAAAT